MIQHSQHHCHCWNTFWKSCSPSLVLRVSFSESCSPSLVLLVSFSKSRSPSVSSTFCDSHRISFTVSKWRPFSCSFIFGKSRADAIGSPCHNGRVTHMLRELGELVYYSREASSCPRTTGHTISAKWPPSDASEHCSRTCR